MKKFLLLNLFFMFLLSPIFSVESIVGFWKTVDENSGRPQSIVGIYEYQGKYYGRLLATYNENGKIDDTIYKPKDRAPGVVGHPYYAGLDIIWNLTSKGNKLTNGHILDPQKGKIYGAEMWLLNNNLIVRGKLLIFGRNQTWLPVADNEFVGDFKKPNLKTFVPSIPRVR